MYEERPVMERLAIANKICKAEETPLLTFSFRDLKNIERSASHIEPDKLFPYGRHLSESINRADFIHSLLTQPKVWMRVREEYSAEVENELQQKNISFAKDQMQNNAWSVEPGFSLDELESFQKGYFEIQDLSSQKTISMIQPKESETWWDACAGSGGKSLMMAATQPSVKLVCTDARDTILMNLKKRFEKTGFKDFKTNVIELATGRKPRLNVTPDGAVADVPCTGSGTWSRTPEWLSFFNTSSIAKYQMMQRNIVKAIADILPEGKPLVYITCSVFKEENEENTAWIGANLPLNLQRQVYFEGAAKRADTLFAARFIKR